MLRVSPGPSKVKCLSGAPLKGKLLALTTNIRLGWKGLPGTNALAYYKKLYLMSVKSFITLAIAVTKFYETFFV
jgi:hypothetical protein